MKILKELAKDFSGIKNDVLKALGMEKLNFDNIKVALILALVSVILIKVILRLLDRFLKKFKIDKSLHTFIRTSVKVVLYFVMILIVTNKLGIGATFLTVFGILGGALALSSQGLLLNVFGGLTLLLTRSFNVDDFVEIGDTKGKVVDIGVVYTKINTGDNRIVFIPNGQLVNAKVVNYSMKENRRIDILISASYEDDVNKVKKAISNAIKANTLILQEEEVLIRIKEYSDSSINYLVRVWTKSENYDIAYFDLLENIKDSFDECGVSIPYNQLEVKLIGEEKEKNI